MEEEEERGGNSRARQYPFCIILARRQLPNSIEFVAGFVRGHGGIRGVRVIMMEEEEEEKGLI